MRRRFLKTPWTSSVAQEGYYVDTNGIRGPDPACTEDGFCTLDLTDDEEDD